MSPFPAVFARREYLIMAFVFLTLWAILLVVSGSAFSGFHLADDHEILTIHDDLLTHPPTKVFVKWFWHDFDVMHRFRPFYFVQRILLTKLFGTNFTVWLFYTGILAVGTTFLLYYGSRLSGFSFRESFLFAMLVLLGPQAVVWWSLGPNENIAMLFLATSWVCMLLALRKPRYDAVFRCVMVISAILSALSKESFLLMLPALIFLMVWIYHTRKEVSWRKAYILNLPAILILASFMFFVFLILVQNVGFEGYGHGGGIDHLNFFVLFKTAVNITLSFSTIGIGLIILSCAFLFFFDDFKPKYIFDAAPSLVLFGLIVVPQLMIYARCGIFGRYVLPLILGYAGLLMCFLRFLRKDEHRLCFKGRRIYGFFAVMASGIVLLGYLLHIGGSLKSAHFLRFGPLSVIIAVIGTAILAGLFFLVAHVVQRKKQGFSLYQFGLLLAALLVIFKYALSFAGASAYAQHGRDIQAFFSNIDEHTNDNDSIIIVIDHRDFRSEASYSIREFLRLISGRTHVSFVVTPGPEGSCPPYHDDGILPGMTSCVIVFNDLENDFLQCPPAWFKRADFERIQNGIFISFFPMRPKEAAAP